MSDIKKYFTVSNSTKNKQTGDHNKLIIITH